MSQRGFTLIELAFTVTIIGLLIGGGLFAIGPIIDKTNVTKTNNNMDQVENALELFAIRFSRLPCPADGSLPAGSLNYGLEQPAGGGSPCTIGSAAAVIPWRTLGIDESYSLDGWNNRLTYNVAQPNVLGLPGTTTALTTGAPLTHTGATGYPTGPFMTVMDANSGAAVTPPPPPPPTNTYDQAAYVLVSHGKSGWYAYGKGATQPRAALFSGGAKSCNSNPAGCSIAVNSYVTGTAKGAYPPASNAYFDDIVRWRSPAFIIQMCGQGSCGNNS